jgi:X-Pro dipeptidyl-peptidase
MRTRLALAASALLLGSLVVPATAAPAPPSGSSPDGPAVPEPAQLQKVDGEVTRSYSVPTRHGALYLEVVHPTLGGEVLPAHGLLTLSPYSALGRNRDRKDWVPRGYARMYADVVGTGNSGGCFDYGGHREKESAHDLVEWVAQQAWSLGRVGMIGGSYDGTTATAAAVTRPAGLATIVPEVGISRWYDYAYSGGMRYFLGNEPLGHQGPGAVTDEGFDTPLAFDFGLAVPPPLDARSPDWKDRVADNLRVCDEVEHTEHGYDTTPTYDAFWERRDYAADAHEVTIPVMVVHNWGDWNVKQDTGYRLFEALTSSKEKRLYFGTRWEGHGRPGGNYKATKLAWIDRWVGGVKNGLERALPTVVSQTSTSEGAGDFVWGKSPRTTPLTLSSTADGRLTAGAAEAGSTGPIPFSVAGTESTALANLAPVTPAGGYVVLQSEPLAEDVRIFGSPTIDVAMGTGRTWTTLTPAVVDVDPGTRAGGLATDPAAAVAVTRGWLDTRYAGGLDRLHADDDGDGVLRARVEAKPMDWTFRAGHRIALVVQTSSLEWAVPKAYDGAPCPTCATWSLGLGPETSLTLPVVGKTSAARLFAPAQ